MTVFINFFPYFCDSVKNLYGQLAQKEMSTAEVKELKKELSSVIRETIQTEMMKIRAELIPYVSENEQNEIESLYDKPLR